MMAGGSGSIAIDAIAEPMSAPRQQKPIIALLLQEILLARSDM
jgi:hypothetical protein